MNAARRQRVLSGLAGIACAAILVWLALRRLDTRALAETLRAAHPLPWVPLGVACYVAGQLTRGERLRVLVLPDAALTLRTASNVVVTGYASNNVLPFRLGELVRAVMLSQRTGVPVVQTLTVTFLERVFDGIAILFLLGMTTFASRSTGWTWDDREIAGAALGVVVVALSVAILSPTWLPSIASRASARLGARRGDVLLRLATNVTNAGAALRRPADALRVAMLTLVVWLFEAAMFVSILPAFELPMKPTWGVLAMSLTNLGLVAPTTPGFLGPFHDLCSRALVSQGVPAATALAFATVVHASFYVPVTLWGAISILWYALEAGHTAALARWARRSPALETVDGVALHVIARTQRASTISTATPMFYRSLVAALLPPRARATEEAIAHVATFLFEEIDALPPRLRILFHTGMFGFRTWVRLRHFASFDALPLDRRRGAVNAWAFGRVALLRKLCKPPLSITLLCYYDLPERPLVQIGSRSRTDDDAA